MSKKLKLGKIQKKIEAGHYPIARFLSMTLDNHENHLVGLQHLLKGIMAIEEVQKTLTKSEIRNRTFDLLSECAQKSDGVMKYAQLGLGNNLYGEFEVPDTKEWRDLTLYMLERAYKRVQKIKDGKGYLELSDTLIDMSDLPKSALKKWPWAEDSDISIRIVTAVYNEVVACPLPLEFWRI